MCCECIVSRPPLCCECAVKFSKVSPPLNWLYEMTNQLNFENLNQKLWMGIWMWEFEWKFRNPTTIKKRQPRPFVLGAIGRPKIYIYIYRYIHTFSRHYLYPWLKNRITQESVPWWFHRGMILSLDKMCVIWVCYECVIKKRITQESVPWWFCLRQNHQLDKITV